MAISVLQDSEHHDATALYRLQSSADIIYDLRWGPIMFLYSLHLRSQHEHVMVQGY